MSIRVYVRASLPAFVIRSPLEKQITSLTVGRGNLLIACMKIATSNQHCSAPSFLLGHEDLGMMNIIQVIPPASAAASAPMKVIASAKTHSSTRARGTAKPIEAPASTAAGMEMKVK